MKGDRSVQCQERVCRIHEPFFLVRLQREDCHPDVEWRNEDPCPEPGLFHGSAFSKLGLKQDDWSHSNRQDKPDVEVQQKVSYIVVVRLGPEYVWSSIFASKDIIKDKSQWNNHQLTIEECVD